MSTPIVRPDSRRLRDWWYAPVLIVAGILLPGWFAPTAHANPVTDAVAVYGLSVWASRYSDAEQASWIARAESGESYKSIARSTGAHPTHISRIVRGIYRKAVA